ncbi:MAG TPA: CdaR family protein [Fimbriimonadaceae bacterium]|nr:CdaR family protein [Fimbriimonadaceae bacterium]
MRSQRLGKVDVPLMVASLFLAFVLWLFVQSQSALATTMQFQKPLEVQGLNNEELIVTSIPGDVVIEAQGTREQLDRIDPNLISAFVDLSKVEPGGHRVRVQLKAPSGPTWSLIRPYADVVVERLARRTMVVQVVMQGEVPPESSLAIAGATARPESVVVYGPMSEIAKVDRVRALLNLSEVRAGEARSTTLEVLDDNNKPLGPLVRTDPTLVTLDPAVVPAESQKSVIVDPLIEGEPAPGHRVRGYQIRPSLIQVRGSSERLAELTTISTAPINISGLTANATRAVRLRLPRGVSASGSASVSVTIQIEKTASPPPTEDERPPDGG